MDWITTPDDLKAQYGQPGEAATAKVAAHLTPAYRAWIDRSRFCILSTIGPEGTDGSPRGDMLREISQGRIDGKAYDADWPGRAALTMW